MASALTIKLVLTARRATLRQIQESLAEMPEQLREDMAWPGWSRRTPSEV